MNSRILLYIGSVCVARAGAKLSTWGIFAAMGAGLPTNSGGTLVAVSVAHVDIFFANWFARRRILNGANNAWNDEHPRGRGLWSMARGWMLLEGREHR